MDKDKQLEFLRKLQSLKGKGIKSEDYTSPLDKDVNFVRGLPEQTQPTTVIHGTKPKIDTKEALKTISGDEFSDKIAKLRALKSAGKKIAGVLPFAGAGIAALSGDPAMAAEELASDLTGIDAESAGESPEDEAMMLAEDKARKNYEKSPARLSKLGKIIGKSQPRLTPEQIRAIAGTNEDQILKEAASAQLKNDIKENQSTDPQVLRNLKLRKLFEGQ